MVSFTAAEWYQELARGGRERQETSSLCATFCLLSLLEDRNSSEEKDVEERKKSVSAFILQASMVCNKGKERKEQVLYTLTLSTLLIVVLTQAQQTNLFTTEVR